MRALGLLLLLAGVLAFYLLAGNRLDERQVRDFYQRGADATLALDDKALCATVADDFQQVITIKLESAEKRETFNKVTYCDNAAETMKQMRQLRDAMGGRSPIRYSQAVVSVNVAGDRRSAEVEMRATLELPGVRMVSRTRDTVVRKRWKMYGTASDAVIWMGPQSD